mmetsp:Transcript_16027/g.43557  ORF Transcript_16027/g.43557 Transcript_16027/m.43557 type:complete len:204 (+) Transcript_16027:823-1434(+)
MVLTQTCLLPGDAAPHLPKLAVLIFDHSVAYRLRSRSTALHFQQLWLLKSGRHDRTTSRRRWRAYSDIFEWPVRSGEVETQQRDVRWFQSVLGGKTVVNITRQLLRTGMEREEDACDGVWQVQTPLLRVEDDLIVSATVVLPTGALSWMESDVLLQHETQLCRRIASPAVTSDVALCVVEAPWVADIFIARCEAVLSIAPTLH